MLFSSKARTLCLALIFVLLVSFASGCKEVPTQVIQVTNPGGLAGIADGSDNDLTTPNVTPTPAPTLEPTPVITIDPDKPIIALTFDDGPHTPVTNRILDLAEQYGIHVTFFVVGDRIAGREAVVMRAHELGCQVENHTYDHKVKLKDIDRQTLYAALDPVDDALEKVIGQKTTLVRPVGGFYDENVLSMMDKPFIFWSNDTEDWRSRDKDAIVEHIKTNVKDGDIILMHDLYSTTADACEEAIPWLIEQGYQLVTVSELFQARGIELKAGQKYFKAPGNLATSPAPTTSISNAPETQTPSATESKDAD